jgi:UDP-2-acetamido-3-amino-2,3-dideoxy-glucuronate N-acetyltransferase
LESGLADVQRPQTVKAPKGDQKFFVHETAVVDEGCQIGEGTKIWHYTHVQKGAVIGKNCVLGQNVNVGNNVRIGNHVKIQNNVSIYEGVTLEDYVFCGPSMVFTNILDPRCEFPQRGSEFYVRTLVKYGASIGANATIVCGNTIGRFAFVGAGALVTKDVPDYALVVGNPAFLVGWMCRCGKRLTFDGENAQCSRCSRLYRKEGDHIVCEKDAP